MSFETLDSNQFAVVISQAAAPAFMLGAVSSLMGNNWELSTGPKVGMRGSLFRYRRQLPLQRRCPRRAWLPSSRSVSVWTMLSPRQSHGMSRLDQSVRLRLRIVTLKLPIRLIDLNQGGYSSLVEGLRTSRDEEEIALLPVERD